ncbi:UNVERIFIED_CONTAM: hypothetical protein GTU68_065755 [Idotea baltica]|nr:hypothetical protein [Idotea baltica]
MESDLSLVKGGDLKSRTRKSIRILKEIKSYRGIRHKLRLPVRGQRSKTNSRTVRKR